MKKIQVVNKSSNLLPEYATKGAAGIDLKASLKEPICLFPGERCLVPTDLYLKIPEGYELQIRTRSGLALKSGIFVLNSPGTIDEDYTGNVGVILFNTNEKLSKPFIINNGDRIAQAVLKKVEKIVWEQVEKLPDTERNGNGFGSTGTK